MLELSKRKDNHQFSDVLIVINNSICIFVYYKTPTHKDARPQQKSEFRKLHEQQ